MNQYRTVCSNTLFYHQYNETNLMYFSFNWLRIKGPLHVSSITCSSSGGASQAALGLLRACNVSWLHQTCRLAVDSSSCRGSVEMYNTQKRLKSASCETVNSNFRLAQRKNVTLHVKEPTRKPILDFKLSPCWKCILSFGRFPGVWTLCRRFGTLYLLHRWCKLTPFPPH
jgi:hypothetical protein